MWPCENYVVNVLYFNNTLIQQLSERGCKGAKRKDPYLRSFRYRGVGIYTNGFCLETR